MIKLFKKYIMRLTQPREDGLFPEKKALFFVCFCASHIDPKPAKTIAKFHFYASKKNFFFVKTELVKNKNWSIFVFKTKEEKILWQIRRTKMYRNFLIKKQLLWMDLQKDS